jgi:hypothetical protein
MWRQAAFFSQLSMSRPYGIGNEYELLDKRGHYDVTTRSVRRMPRYKTDVTPQFLLNGEKPRDGESWREAYARMLTEDPQFARATVNLIWAELIGVGIVDPPLDFDPARLDPAKPPPAPWTIQPSHPELLEALAKDFREHNYDLRRLIRLIVTSSTYQLSSHFDGEWKAAYAPYFARHFVRRLPAETIADAISQATGIFPSISINDTNVKVGYVMQARSSEDLHGKELEPLHLLGVSGRPTAIKPTATSQIDRAGGRPAQQRIRRDGVKIKTGGSQAAQPNPRSVTRRSSKEMFLAFLARPPRHRKPPLLSRP